MNLYNNKITRRTNLFIREKIIMPEQRKKLKNNNFSIICNNCTAGFVLHDLNQRFNSPTINMFFYSMDFFDFAEHLDYYITQPLKFIKNPKYDPAAPDYPVAVIEGNENYKTIELHFLHYKNKEEAEQKWNTRKERINFDNLFLIFSFVGLDKDEDIYRRAEKIPIKNKVFFVNHSVDNKLYPSFFYIKGFEKDKGLGLISNYTNLFGKRYYDQFDFVKWLNERKKDEEHA